MKKYMLFVLLCVSSGLAGMDPSRDKLLVDLAQAQQAIYLGVNIFTRKDDREGYLFKGMTGYVSVITNDTPAVSFKNRKERRVVREMADRNYDLAKRLLRTSRPDLRKGPCPLDMDLS